MSYHTLMAELEALEQAAPAQTPRYKEKFGAADAVFYAQMRLALQIIKPATDIPATDCKPVLRESKRGSAAIQPASDCKNLLRDDDEEETFSDDKAERFAADDALDHLRVALQTMETANEPPERVYPHPSPAPMCPPPLLTQTSFPGAKSHAMHPFRRGMLQKWSSMVDPRTSKADTRTSGHEEPAAFGRSGKILRSALRPSSPANTPHGSFRRTQGVLPGSFQPSGGTPQGSFHDTQGSFHGTRGSSFRSVISHVSFDTSVDFEKHSGPDAFP